MDRLEHLTQSYSQAPWRKQLQIIGVFLLVLVFVALISGVYLNVSARAAQAGRAIQDMQRDIEALGLDIEDRQSELAMILSSSSMEERARAMGFEIVGTDEIVYLSVPGYAERQSVILAPASERVITRASVTPPEYTESLFTWIKRHAGEFTLFRISEVQP
jgi:hypothetical protein